MDFEKIVRETVAEWSYSGRMGSAKGLELLVSDLTARLESAQQSVQATGQGCACVAELPHLLTGGICSECLLPRA